MTPRERYKKDIDLVKYMPDEKIEKSFLNRISRKVRKDATISFKNTYYEVPQIYIGQKINLRHSPDDLSKLYLINDNKEIVKTVYPLRKVDNSKIKRKVIDYSKIGGKTHE